MHRRLVTLSVRERGRGGRCRRPSVRRANEVRASPQCVCAFKTIKGASHATCSFERNCDGGSVRAAGGRGRGREPTERTTHEVPGGRGGVGRRVHGQVRGEHPACAEPDDREQRSRGSDPARHRASGGRGTPRWSRRAVRRERGPERSARGVLRVDVLGHRVRDPAGRGRVCLARVGTPGDGGQPRTGERLDAVGELRRRSPGAGRGAHRGNARERVRRKRPGALAAGRRELCRRGPGRRVARHFGRADRAREAGREGLHGRARGRARHDPRSGCGRTVACGRRRRRIAAPHGRRRRSAHAAGRLSGDRGDPADARRVVRDLRRRIWFSRKRLRPDATGRDRPAARGDLFGRQRHRPGDHPRDRTSGRCLRGGRHGLLELPRHGPRRAAALRRLHGCVRRAAGREPDGVPGSDVPGRQR